MEQNENQMFFVGDKVICYQEGEVEAAEREMYGSKKIRYKVKYSDGSYGIYYKDSLEYAEAGKESA